MSPSARRDVLRAGSLTLAAALAGCTSYFGTSTERQPEFDTPPPGECEAVDLRKSGPTEGGLEPVEYPAYPEEVTAETARSFARDFEHAYRRNEFVQRYEDTWSDELTVYVEEPELVDERGGEDVVRVDGELVHGDSEPPESATGTARPAGRDSFTAWFYLADRYAIRYANPSAEEPDFEYGEVVVCEG